MWAAAGVREATVRVQVRRADGRVEDLGVVGRFEREPGRGLLFTARRWWARSAEPWRALVARAKVGLSALVARLNARGAGVGVARNGRRAPAWGGAWRRFGAGKER